MLQLIGETVIEADLTLQESMVKKTVRNVPVNIKDQSLGTRAQPATVTVEADIPEQIVQVTPELAMLFRAMVSGSADTKTEEFPVQVSGVSLPGHAPIVVLSVTPEKVRINP